MLFDRDFNIYHTPLIEGAIATQDLAAIRGFYGFFPIPVDSLRMTNAQNVRFSLATFLRDIPNYLLQEYAYKALKTDSVLDPVRFCVSSVQKKNKNKLVTLSDSYTYLDGQYGFTLGYYQGFNITWLATISFDSYNKPQEDDSRNCHPKKPEGPFIKQLQAYFYSDRKSQLKQNTILKQLRWELLLSSLVVNWADGIGLPAAYFEPGDRSHHSLGREERFFMRHDVTARKLGFKPNQYGDYELQLTSYPLSQPTETR